MRKKRILSLFATVAMAFYLAGCQANYIDMGQVEQTNIKNEQVTTITSPVSEEDKTTLSYIEETLAPFINDYKIDIDIYAKSDSEYTGIKYNQLSDKYYAIEISSDMISLSDLSYSESLKELTISMINSDTLEGIENFPNLEYLKIQDVNIRDISALSKCKNLKVLIIRFIDTIEDYSVLSQLENLTELFVILCENGNTAPNIEAISSCTKLETLSLQGFTIHDIDFIDELKSLKYLRLWSYKIPIKNIHPIKNLDKLEKLEITYDYISEDIDIFKDMIYINKLSIDTSYSAMENEKVNTELSTILPNCEIMILN